MAFFQVQLKKGTKTITENIESKDYKDILEYYYKLSSCEVIEIREWLEKEKTTKKDDGDYIKAVSIVLRNGTKESLRFRLPKLKKSIDENELDNIIISNLTIGNKKPNRIEKTYTF